MKNLILFMLCAFCICFSLSVQAQNGKTKNKKEVESRSEESLQRSAGGDCQMDVQGPTTSSTSVFNADVNFVGNANIIGVKGYSVPSADIWGTGGHFTGGWFGVRAFVPTMSTGDFSSYALQGINNSTGTGSKYGVYGQVNTLAIGTHYGVYGTASGGAGSILWAGYFDGNVNVTGDITATNFIGDGSQLTNLPSSGGCTKYGDGSAGDLTISGPTNWSTTPPTNRNFMFQNLTIDAGQTLTVSSGTVIMVSENFINNGTIEVLPGIPGVQATSNINGTFPRVDGYSYDQFNPYSAEQLRFEINPSHIAGGNGEDGSINTTSATAVTNNIQEGGSGGGSMVIRAGLGLENFGTINAVGGNGIPHNITTQDFSGAGGGGGGFVILLSPTINNAGTINVNGGNGTNPGTGDDDHAGGGGGGGLIHFISGNADAVGGTSNISGGLPGATPSGNVGTTGGDGGCSAGAGGRGGTDVDNVAPAIQPETGGVGLVLRTKVAEPCNLSFD